MPFTLLYLIMTPLSWWLLGVYARRSFRQSPLLAVEQQVTCDAEAIRFVSSRGTARYSWSDFHRWAADEKTLLLYQNGLAFFAVPFHAFRPGASRQISEWIEAAGLKKR